MFQSVSGLFTMMHITGHRLLLFALCALLSVLAPAHAQPGKPNAGLGISPDSYQLQAGSTQSVTLDLSSLTDRGHLRLNLSTSSEDLELLSPRFHEFDLAEDATPSLTVDLLPHRDGRYYLMMTAEIQQAGLPDQAQALGVVIHVGQARQQLLKATAAPAVISLPARESIRTP